LFFILLSINSEVAQTNNFKRPDAYRSKWFKATKEGMGTNYVDRSANLQSIKARPIPCIL